MTDYLDLAITTDATTLFEDGIDAIRSQADPGWVASPIEEWILMATARMAVEVAVLAGEVPLAIFTYFGESVLGIPAMQATQATGTVTFALADTAGHTITAGTQLDIDGVAFLTTDDLTITAGGSTGSVGVDAATAGADGNDLAGAIVTLVSPTYVFVTSVALDAPTVGGVDAEDPAAYADRLADELPTLSPKAILIGDFEALARRNPLVGRALAIDNYDPGPPEDTAAEGHVAVAVHDAVGEPLSSGPKAEIAADLEANRVLNIVVHVIDPTYTTVDVSFTATAYAGYDPASVKTAGEAAIREFLDLTVWGRPPGSDATAWINETTLRRNDLFGVLYDVEGIRHVTALTLALGGGSLATSDVTLAGPAALPRAGTITGTVT